MGCTSVSTDRTLRCRARCRDDNRPSTITAKDMTDLCRPVPLLDYRSAYSSSLSAVSLKQHRNSLGYGGNWTLIIVMTPVTMTMALSTAFLPFPMRASLCHALLKAVCLQRRMNSSWRRVHRLVIPARDVKRSYGCCEGQHYEHRMPV